MPDEYLGTGFYGKIPATGDFVGRGLPGDFVLAWDRWVASHLAPLQSSGAWPEDVALRFLLGPDANGPMAGIVVTSNDRAGRRFPLTVAAPLSAAASGVPDMAAKWFEDIEMAADAARYAYVSADQFAANLATLPFPAADMTGEPVPGMVLWAGPWVPVDVDPAAPQAALGRLLTASWETS
ncbi:type VI secretion system-associated protein TagF [Aminobacter sp. UC22_36]|uniref:type VI secretion system-associated protein TagF n=1 Tax=Aminobacter sp. UC22_36 TaxID=3374549 RepID=UPI0037583D7A